jgi:hypothetical protein
MKPETERWLEDAAWNEALDALRKEGPRETELPTGVRGAVRVRLSTSLASLGGPSLRAGETHPQLMESPEWEGVRHHASAAPTTLKAAAQLGWLPGAAKVLLSGLLVGGSAMLVWPKTESSREMPPSSMAAGTEDRLKEESSEASRLAADSQRAAGSFDPVEPPSRPAELEERAALLAAKRTRPSSQLVNQRPGSLPKKVPRDTKTDLDYELTLLRLARAALADRPAFAKELLRNYDKLFPEGVLRNEYELLLKRAESLPKESLNPVE